MKGFLFVCFCFISTIYHVHSFILTLQLMAAGNSVVTKTQSYLEEEAQIFLPVLSAISK